jgi:hypothetical protein
LEVSKFGPAVAVDNPPDAPGEPLSLGVGLFAGVPRDDIVRQAALFGARSGDGWGVGLTILTALANLRPALPDGEAYLALFHGAR